MRLSLCIILLLITNLCLCQKDYIIKSKRISLAEGLPTRWTKCMVEDDNHLIWTGTTKGLSRWDGFKFTNLDHTNSALRIKEVYNLTKDGNGNIWAYNVTKDFKFSKNPRPQHFYYSNKSIDIVIPLTFEIQSFNDYVNGLLSEKNIRSIITTVHGIWIETYDQRFYMFDKNLEEVKIPNLPTDLEYLVPANINKNYYWAYSKNTIFYYDKEGSLIHQIPLDREEELIEVSQYKNKLFVLSKIKSNNQANIYVINSLGKTKQLDHQNLGSISITPVDYSRIRFQINSLNNNLINIRTRSKNSIFNEDLEPVIIPELDSILDQNPSNYSISDNNNYLWQSTSDGLLALSIQTKLFNSYLASNTTLFPTRSLTSINNDTLIVLSEDGINQIAKANPSFKKSVGQHKYQGVDILEISDHRFLATVHGSKILDIDLRKNSIDTVGLKNTGRTLCKDQNDKIWIGTIIGICQYDPSSKSITYDLPVQTDSILRKQEVNFIYANKKGLWICTQNGIFLLDQDHHIVNHYNIQNGLPFNKIYHIHEDSISLWLGTDGGGLIQWNPNTQEYKQYTTDHGLSNNYVHAVYQDSTGYLWLPTDYGVSVFNIQEKQFNVFTTDHGLTNNECNKYSHYQDDNGDLYFGTINGINRFNPYFLNQQLPNTNPVVLLKFDVRDSRNSEYISKMSSYKENNEIILSPSNDYVNIEFSSAEFLQKELIGYYYRIEGLSSDWEFLKTNNLQLGKLPHGKYNLKIKSNKNFSTNEDAMLSIQIIVEKPFYLKWPFIAGLALLAGLLSHFSIKWRLSYLKNSNTKLQKEVDARTSELHELNQSKNKLFAILAHDLKAPIGSFKNLSKKVNYLIKHGEWETLDQMNDQIEAKTRRLDKMLGNLLPWILTQAQNPELKSSLFNITDAVNNTIDELREEFVAKNIKIINDLPDQLSVYADEASIQIILRNLISNAIKYSNPDSSIQIQSVSEKDKRVLHIIDEGTGMTKQQIESLFIDYKSTEGTRGEKGTGLGLSLSKDLAISNGGQLNIESTLKAGTIATVMLPYAPR